MGEPATVEGDGRVLEGTVVAAFTLKEVFDD
jgi:hypothetical protein